VRILVLTTQVPFIQGGAERLAAGLVQALIQTGHEAEIVAVPFKWYPPERILDHMLACHLLDLTEVCGQPVDRVIGLKFPTYLIPHPRKTLWLVHQYRTAYDLWDSDYSDLIGQPNGLQVREAIRQADRQLATYPRRFTISANVARRLQQFNGITAAPLYSPPPLAERFYCDPEAGYLFFPSRISLTKRQQLVLEALQHTRNPVRVVFAGAADSQSDGDRLTALVAQWGLADRVQFLGPISDDRKLDCYARAIAVLYPPLDEDYGYVTLEAMLAAKPVITCRDSGGPLEFVRSGQTGWVVDPTPEALAAAMDEAWENRAAAKLMGEDARSAYADLNISWDNVVKTLLG
jgi:glycosyltransferase involved in cell wall biosynthesis